ncbi:beta-hexosaminidase [Sedimentimonas flavescens]|uniref:beta-N-acetylhexosaminidase n=1 Tax=Sedimentimonas flavescens TaxID=2851012 RepID=A0ABT2ZYA0_9RHOB|nr:glycoside hydrolase family 3 N-terminal domain-containing protein [Sedimentimonas flavescens]MCV2878733.1 beta-hexosaminidase [Sedimentimonas flavescens]
MMPAGATIFGCEGLDLSPSEAAFFRASDPWGFILFSRNIETPEQVARLCSSLREAVGRDAPILIDQEGGRVQRLRAPHWREWLPPLDQARAASDARRSFWLRARIQAHELRAIGIDANCAPTCDIAGPRTHPFLQNRCLGTDAATVIANARATAEGFLAGGVLPILKHMPGHGRAEADSHLDLPVVGADPADLAQTDFAPFRALRDLPLGMTAHIRFTAFDQAPATQSRKMIALIREQIGFDGLLMTDDIGMEALSGSKGARAAASIAAGCDVVLYCKGDMGPMEEVAEAAGQLTPEAAARADAALARRHAPDPVDIAALEAELVALLGDGADV